MSDRTNASPNDEAMRRMSKLVNNLLARSDSAPFREPVDWRGLELWDYPKIIKKMMDLGTVKRKLERSIYPASSDCAEDIRLIWKNCKTYNADGSDFFLLAEAFSRRFEERYKKIRAEFEEPQLDKITEKKEPTLEIKAKFGSNVYRLSGLELGHVLQVLDMRCPHALETVMDIENSLEINVDLIDPRTFNELDSYVREKVSNQKRGDAAVTNVEAGGGTEKVEARDLMNEDMEHVESRKNKDKKGNGNKRKR